MTEKKIETVTPNALKHLVERIGQKETAEKLGLAQSSISKMLRDNECRTTWELSARYLLSKMDKEQTSPKVMIARVPADKVELVRQFLNALDVKSQCV